MARFKFRNFLWVFGILLVFGLFLPAAGQGLGEDDSKQKLRDFCETAPCRHDVQFSLDLSDGDTLEFSAELAPPAAGEGYISIYPGENLFIEAEAGEGGPAKFVQVLENIHPERTLVIHFFQNQNSMDGLGMMLSVQNPFDRILKYQALIMPPEDTDFYEASTCPVIAKGSGYEMWPEPIFQVVLIDLEFIGEEDSLACK